MGENSQYRPTLNRHRLVHVVDPDPTACEELADLFRLEGFEAACSVDATAFLDALESRVPDAVVLNLRLKGDSGLVLLRRIKAVSDATPVLMIAEGTQVNEAVAAIKLGAVDVISAPVNTEHLLGTIREALQQHVHVTSSTGGASARGRARVRQAHCPGT